jgi:hypothetical protein
MFKQLNNDIVMRVRFDKTDGREGVSFWRNGVKLASAYVTIAEAERIAKSWLEYIEVAKKQDAEKTK